MGKYRVFIELVIEADNEEDAEDFAVHSLDEHDDFIIDRIEKV